MIDDVKEKVRAMYFDAKMDIKTISKELNLPLSMVKKYISKTNLSRISKGTIQIENLLLRIWPAIRIIKEYPIGDQYIDIYLPDLKIGIEYDGEFHYKNTPWNTGSLAMQMNRDERKDAACEAAGISLIRVSYKDIKKLTPDALYEKIKDAIEKRRKNEQ